MMVGVCGIGLMRMCYYIGTCKNDRNSKLKREGPFGYALEVAFFSKTQKANV